MRRSPQGLSRTSLALSAALIVLSAAGCGQDGGEREEPTPPTVDSLRAEQLGALGYVAWTDIPEDDREKRGVVLRDSLRSQPGLNLWWSSLPHQKVVLMDGEGRTMHLWQREMEGEWAGDIELFDNGDVLLFHQGPNRLVRLDWDSNVVWETPMLAHHDIDVAGDGRIYVLSSRRRRPVRSGDDWYLVEKDYLVILDGEGSVERELSFFDLLRSRIDLGRAPRLGGDDGVERPVVSVDPTHVNTLSILREDRNEIFRKGRVLFAARNLNLIGVVDVDREEVVWSWGSEDLDWPHQPVLTPSGRILVFDNGAHRGWSRIVEVEPRSGEIVWEYRGDPPESFFSRTMGGVQLLANGNLLVTESARGRVFEIDRRGEIVWDFFNPDIDEQEGKRATVYRMARIDEASLDGRIEETGPSSEGPVR